MNPPEASPILLILIRHDRDRWPLQDVANPAELPVSDRLWLLVEGGHDLRPLLPRHEGKAERMEGDIPGHAGGGEVSDAAPFEEGEFGIGGAASQWRFLQSPGSYQVIRELADSGDDILIGPRRPGGEIRGLPVD